MMVSHMSSATDTHITSIIQGAVPEELHFITDTDVGYMTAQSIRFFSVTQRFSVLHRVREDLIFHIPYPNYGLFRTAANKGLFCYANLEQPVSIFIQHFPDFAATARIDGVAAVELLDVALTYTKLLIALLGRTENQVKIWNWENGTVFCSLKLADIYVPNIKLSLSPWNWRDFAISGEKSLRLFTIDQGIEDDPVRAVINKIPFQLPYSRNSTAKIPTDLFQCHNTGNPQDYFSLEAIAQVSASLTETFTDEVLDRIRTVPSCHTWHVDGSIYIGTTEGTVVSFHPHHATKPPATLNLDIPPLAITEIVTSKEGFALTNSEQEFRFALMNSPTEIQYVIMPMESERVQRLWQSARSDLWIAMTDTAKFCVFTPGDIKPTFIYNRKEMARFLAIGKFYDNSFFTLQEHGILKIWNFVDEPEFTYQLSFDATIAVASPVIDCSIVGSKTGFIHILDCTYCHNGQQPRLLQSIRIFSSPITQLKFDLSGAVLMAAAENPRDRLVVLSGLPSKEWKILGVVRLPGALTEFHAVKDDDGNAFVAAGVATGKDTAIATELITFRLSPALCEDPAPFYSNPLDEFTETCIVQKRLKLKVPFRTFAVDSHNSIFFATETKHLIHAKSDSWSRTPTVLTGTASLTFPIVQCLFLPQLEHLLLVDSQGSFSVRFVGFFTEIGKDDVRLGRVTNVAWKQNAEGFHVYYVMWDGRLVCRTTPVIPELEQELRVDVSDNFTAEMELMKDHLSKEPNLVGSYNALEDPVNLENTTEEAWMTAKSRLCQEKLDSENIVRSASRRTKYQLLKEQILKLYRKNAPLNGIFRVRDDYFELIDEGWAKLRKQREVDICEAKVSAHLELISQRLMKDLLLLRYSHPLATQRSTIYGIGSAVKVSSFPVPKRTTPVLLTEKHVLFQRDLLQHFERMAKERPKKLSETQSTTVNPAVCGAVSANPVFTAQVMRTICANTAAAKTFNSLYSDDLLTSRAQRMNELALLRECQLLIKEKFNRHFDAMMQRKSMLRVALRKKMDLIRKKMLTTEKDLSLSSMDLTVRNDEDPQTMIYQVRDHQILEYLKLHNTAIPLVLDSRDRNYGMTAVGTERPLIQKSAVHLTASAHRSHHGLAGRNQAASPADDLLKSASDVIHECNTLIRDFDKDLIELSRLKDRAIFSAGVLDLRAMHLRQRILFSEELSSWTSIVAVRSEKLTRKLQSTKFNVNRARRIFDHIRVDYDKFVQNDAALDHYVKRELHEVSDLDGRMLVQIYRKRPHPLRGLKQVQQHKGHAMRPRTSELKETMTGHFFDTLVQIKDSKHRPEEIDLKTWMKFCELRRKKMESEMTLWMKHVELEHYHGVLKEYLVRERDLQQQMDELHGFLGQAEKARMRYARNADFVLTLTHGQVETECKPFLDYNCRVILIPLDRIEKKNIELQTECQKKMDMLNELVKYREAITLLEWEKEVHKQKITDYEYERQFIASQAAPLELRQMVGKDFGEYREEWYQQLKQSLRQQKQTFKNDTHVWRDKVQLLQQKLVAFQHERANAEASMHGLSIELHERHTVGESIGIHADASESEMRQALVLKRLCLQTRVKEQKKRMEDLRQHLWKWQRKAFPAIYHDTRNC